MNVTFVTVYKFKMYLSERLKIKSILANDSYKTLIKYGADKQGAIIMYLGSETSIDEVVVFGSDNSKGFIIVRLLGNGINPAQLLNLVEVLKNSDFDSEQLKGISEIFNKNTLAKQG